MRVGRLWNVTIRDQKPAGHAEMYQPLNFGCGIAARRCRGQEVEDDRLADPVYTQDPGTLEGGCHGGRGSFEWLRLVTEPGAFDLLAPDALIHAAGHGFDFRKLRHRCVQDA